MAKKETNDQIKWKDLLGGEEAAKRAGRDPEAVSGATIVRRVRCVQEPRNEGKLVIEWEVWQEFNGTNRKVLDETTEIGPKRQPEIRHPKTDELIRGEIPTLTELLATTIPPPRRRTLNTILDIRVALQGMLTEKLAEWYPAWQVGEEGEF